MMLLLGGGGGMTTAEVEQLAQVLAQSVAEAVAAQNTGFPWVDLIGGLGSILGAVVIVVFLIRPLIDRAIQQRGDLASKEAVEDMGRQICTVIEKDGEKTRGQLRNAEMIEEMRRGYREQRRATSALNRLVTETRVMPLAVAQHVGRATNPDAWEKSGNDGRIEAERARIIAEERARHERSETIRQQEDAGEGLDDGKNSDAPPWEIHENGPQW